MSVAERITYQQPETLPLKRSTTASRPWQKIALGIILLLSGVLNFWALDQMGYSNTYYAAAIKSMLQSWHNFFFVSFDAGGFVSVDKPPLGLWLQAASAKIFGFSGVSLILPQAIAGLLSVALLYYLVRRIFGPGTGLISALALAITPVSVVVSRNNIIDSTLILTLLLGTWAVSRAVETGRLRWLLLCALFIGLGFNIKMMQAYLVIPAFGLMYLFGSFHSWRKRIVHLFLASILLLTVSLSWAVAVDLTPASQRPYVGSTQDNSELSLAFGYNGVERLLGMSFGGQRSGNNNQQPPATSSTSNAATTSSTTSTSSTSSQQPPSGMTGQPPQRGNGGGGGAFNTGQAGILRLFNEGLGGQASWLLPLALIGMIVAACQEKVRLPLTRKQQAVVLWGTWLLTMGVFFSVAGFFHQYYLATMAPAIAALAGIGIMALWREYRGGSWRSWLLPVTLAVTAGAQIYMLASYPTWSTILTPVVAGLCALGALGLILALVIPRFRVMQRLQRTAVILAMISLLITPAVWTGITVLQHNGGLTPSAGPSTTSSFGGGNMGGDTEQVDQKLVQYLLAHQGNATYLFATTNSMTADPYIISTGKAVMAMGGFSGSDNILTTQQLAALAKSGQVRYFLISSGNGPGGSSSLTSWIQQNCTVVPTSQWQSSSTSSTGQGQFGAGGSLTLYVYNGS
jgi:4-amino-4-deoxy-L-arabinose transferase-like glycosyltransferase